MIKFEKYEGSTVELSELGTLAEQIGKKGTVDFLKKNFNSTKRVVVLAKNEAGESAIVSCSSPLSEQLRKAKADGATKEQLLASVISLPIYENEVGPFIGLEAGEASTGVSVASLAKVNKVATIGSLEEIPW